MELNPFSELQITSSCFLDELTTRESCAGCHKSRKYFCYTCYTLLPSLANKIPHVKLPFKVHIIKHPGEVSGKSTACHAAVLAPDDVTVYQFPYIPDYDDTSNVILVFPGVNAVNLRDYYIYNHNSSPTGLHLIKETKSHSDEVGDDINSFATVVFIDSTWYQVHTIVSDQRIAKLPRVELACHETKFWRHQLNKPTTYLSTIEAIYYTAWEYHNLLQEHGYYDKYCGQYDDLLFFFVYFYNKIRTVSSDTGKQLKAYHCQRRKK
jgi:DTW domain-containing protein YfiP